ncbi:uncharacterized protein (DUF1330 family) [Neorhizobium galegae]|uniref:DUF1330 domain-containing protein n=1 Tax=Neorhizobium galegae TaxID=399 RepID=UPI00278A2C83|nr:DUF1330 domain-containing protein [Neorhizobium galegae]MDQ0132112.1 uncharacterized protein (DUF1330 family) [Neorhizobium galegae]
MSAYVVVELIVKDEEARKRYASQASKAVAKFGGTFVARGDWQILAGEAGHAAGAILEFSDRERALEWYNSPEYQLSIADREKALDCRFRLLG